MLVSSLFLVSFSYSQYYADILININQEGQTTISGTTNHPQLNDIVSDDLTSKKGNVWTFNLTTNNASFSDIIYEIDLPQNAVINYIKSSSQIKIGEKSGYPYIKGIGTNETLSILVQYSFDGTQDNNTLSSIYIFLVVLIFIVLISAITYLIRIKKKNNVHSSHHSTHISEHHNANSTIDNSKPWYDKSKLLDRQKDIVEILEKNNGSLLQKKLEEQLKIPKSSLSRNIDSLVRQGIITKQEKGMSNVLTLNKTKPELKLN